MDSKARAQLEVDLGEIANHIKEMIARTDRLYQVVGTARETVGDPPDDYLRGMANGLILALHTIEGRSGKPDYIEAPKGETLQRAGS